MRLHAVWISVTLLACAADSGPDVAETSSTVVVDNRLSANRLSANRLSANRLSANRLSANRLSANRLELTLLDENDLVCTEDGREVLDFIISCAIPFDQTITVSGLHAHCGTMSPEPDEYTAFGEVGLAKHWIDKPLTEEGQGWVSACLFSRVNANIVPIPISLRGPDHNLATSPEERAGWPLEEGAFYGNLFGEATLPGSDPPVPDWHACRGVDQRAGETGGLIDRDCAEPDPGNPGFTMCGFAYDGECGFNGGDEACDFFHSKGTFYKRCGGTNRKNAYREVITAYVQ